MDLLLSWCVDQLAHPAAWFVIGHPSGSTRTLIVVGAILLIAAGELALITRRAPGLAGALTLAALIAAASGACIPRPEHLAALHAGVVLMPMALSAAAAAERADALGQLWLLRLAALGLAVGLLITAQATVFSALWAGALAYGAGRVIGLLYRHHSRREVPVGAL